SVLVAPPVSLRAFMPLSPRIIAGGLDACRAPVPSRLSPTSFSSSVLQIERPRHRLAPSCHAATSTPIPRYDRGRPLKDETLDGNFKATSRALDVRRRRARQGVQRNSGNRRRFVPYPEAGLDRLDCRNIRCFSACLPT